MATPTESAVNPARAPRLEDLGEYRPLVRQVALSVAASIPRHVELDELISAGLVGLVEAARRFDPSRGVRFEAYVSERVRGSIIDFLRSLDWAPRSVRSSGKRMEEARTRLTAELGRPPEDHEIAADMEISVEDVRTIRGSISRSVVLTLDRSATDAADDMTDTVASAIPDEDHPMPDELLERKELYGYLTDAVNCLPDQARTVIGLYYIKGMHMAEIGDLLGVTQSRASQIHSAALSLLKDAILTQLDPSQAPDLSNPKGRRAKRMARFFDSVSNASTWKDRLEDEHRTIRLDFAGLLAALEEKGDGSDDFTRKAQEWRDRAEEMAPSTAPQA